jgi:hypothetical protein
VLYAACQRVLRPDGVRDDPGEVISRARAAGLVYAQHIVALHVPVTGSTSVSNAASSSGPATARASRRSRTTARLNPSSSSSLIQEDQHCR